MNRAVFTSPEPTTINDPSDARALAPASPAEVERVASALQALRPPPATAEAAREAAKLYADQLASGKHAMFMVSREHLTAMTTFIQERTNGP